MLPSSHEEGKKYPMPIIKKPRLFRKASLRRRYQNSLSLSLSLSLCLWSGLKNSRERKVNIWMGMIRHGNDYSSCDFYSQVVFGARSVHAISWYPSTYYSGSTEI
jgi:hypothetical protein